MFQTQTQTQNPPNSQLICPAVDSNPLKLSLFHFELDRQAAHVHKSPVEFQCTLCHQKGSLHRACFDKRLKLSRRRNVNFREYLLLNVGCLEGTLDAIKSALFACSSLWVWTWNNEHVTQQIFYCALDPDWLRAERKQAVESNIRLLFPVYLFVLAKSSSKELVPFQAVFFSFRN